jgi:hypothetical protein
MVQQRDIVQILDTVQTLIASASTETVGLVTSNVQNAVDALVEKILQVQTDLHCRIRAIEDDLSALRGTLHSGLTPFSEVGGSANGSDNLHARMDSFGGGGPAPALASLDVLSANGGHDSGGLHGQRHSDALSVRLNSPADPEPLAGQQQSASALISSAAPLPYSPPADDKLSHGSLPYTAPACEKGAASDRGINAFESRVAGAPACDKGQSLPNLSSAHASPSQLLQTFNKDAVKNPSQKQIDRLVRHFNKGTLDENEFVNIFSSRSQRKAMASSSRAADIHTDTFDSLHDFLALRIKKYRFIRSHDRNCSHQNARTAA